jgi:hypothetical protein
MIEPYRLFLSGPMSHRRDTDYNVPAFDAAVQRLSRLGHDVVSPIDHFRSRYGPAFLQQPREVYMQIAADLICRGAFDGIVLLPGWEMSEGAYAEAMLMRSVCGRLWFYDEASETGLTGIVVIPPPPLWVSTVGV